MTIIALLLILIIGMAFTLLGTPDVYSGKAPSIAHRVLSRGSPQDFRSCLLKRRGLFKLAVLQYHKISRETAQWE